MGLSEEERMKCINVCTNTEKFLLNVINEEGILVEENPNMVSDIYMNLAARLFSKIYASQHQNPNLISEFLEAAQMYSQELQRSVLDELQREQN